MYHFPSPLLPTSLMSAASVLSHVPLPLLILMSSFLNYRFNYIDTTCWNLFSIITHVFVISKLASLYWITNEGLILGRTNSQSFNSYALPVVLSFYKKDPVYFPSSFLPSQLDRLQMAYSFGSSHRSFCDYESIRKESFRWDPDQVFRIFPGVCAKCEFSSAMGHYLQPLGGNQDQQL